MKKFLFLLPLFVLCFAFTACDDDDDTAKKYGVAVNVKGSDSIDVAKVTELSVECKNMKNGKKQVAAPMAGVAKFELAAGQYVFTVKGKFDNTDVEGVSEVVYVTKVKDDFVYNVDVALNFAAAKSSLIFKEVYFSGVPDWFWRDGFYEIVNNADTTVYLDGVILAAVDPGLPEYLPAPSVWIENGITDAYPCCSYTVYFPGSGKDHPLAPGQSVVIASSAQNHKDSVNAASPVNLGNADWETFIPTSFNDTDNPDVENMEIAYATFGLDFMPSVDGKNALILARLEPGKSPVDFAADEANLSFPPGKSFPKHLLIPRKYVLDAVDIVCAPSSDRYKNIHKDDDRSYTFMDAGKDEAGEFKDAAYSGKGLRRKVVSVENGIAKFKDTNNSEADFVTTDVPTPHRTFTSAD